VADALVEVWGSTVVDPERDDDEGAGVVTPAGAVIVVVDLARFTVL